MEKLTPIADMGVVGQFILSIAGGDDMHAPTSDALWQIVEVFFFGELVALHVASLLFSSSGWRSTSFMNSKPSERRFVVGTLKLSTRTSRLSTLYLLDSFCGPGMILLFRIVGTRWKCVHLSR